MSVVNVLELFPEDKPKVGVGTRVTYVGSRPHLANTRADYIIAHVEGKVCAINLKSGHLYCALSTYTDKHNLSKQELQRVLGPNLEYWELIT